MRLGKVLNLGKTVCLARISRSKVPINIMWRITNKCNLKCSYCSIWKKKQKELSTKQILGLIDQMKGCGTQRIGFVGGEAFLRPDFEQIIDYVKKKGIYITLVSNGCQVQETLDIVKKLDYLVISFDGTKKNHERGRTKGSFDNVMRCFNFCKRNRIRVLTNTVLNKYNLGDIDYILDTVSAYGFHSTFNLLQGGDCYPSADEYRLALDYLIMKKRKGAPIVLSVKTMKFLKNWSDYRRFTTKKKMKGFKCWAGELIYNIDTDGKIAACDIMTHMKDDNPSCIKHGLNKAYHMVSKEGCQACTCAHVIEYNNMFSFSPSVIKDWGQMIFVR